MENQKVIGYARASTSNQKLTIVFQKQKIKEYCQLKDYDLIEIITDKKSGKNLKRPGIQKVLAMVEQKKIDGLVIFKLDRLFRSTLDAVNTAEKFKKNGVSLHSISENLDTSTPMGIFFYQILSSIAELERAQISERIVNALSVKRKNNEKLGGRIPFGYIVQGKKLVPHAGEQAAIKMICRMRTEENLNYSQISARLNNLRILTKNKKRFYPQSIKNILAVHGGAS